MTNELWRRHFETARKELGLFRADEQLLVNPQIYGLPASFAPVIHLRRVAGGTMVSSYFESFEKVWDSTTIWE
jgi:hypothetical protein